MNGLVFSAFSLGFLGSLHCIGMCGPLALSLPTDRNSNPHLQQSLYHAGRSASYALIGFIAGTLGWGIKWVGWQQGLTIATGMMLLFLVILPRFTGKLKWNYWGQWLRKNMEFLWKDMNPLKRFLFGMLNGLLPCGFVYLALSGALLTASPLDSALFMVFFGLGTWPMMWSLQWLGSKMWLHGWRQRWQKFSPVFTFIVGLILLLRGLGLGIPVLSPSFQEKSPQQVESSCCHKHGTE